MKISEVKKLDDGVSGITIEGRITKTPKEPGNSEYGWSQMIILKDDTDEMGSWINIKSAEDAYKVGQYIKVKGKVSKYVKGGKPGISLNNGNVIDEIQKDEDVSQEKPTETNTQPITQPKSQPIKKEYTNNDYWRDKTLRDIENNKCIVRECAIKAVTEEAVINLFNILNEVQYFGTADKIVNYIYDVLKDKGKITSEAITKEFGGTKEERIAKAKETVKKVENPAWIQKEQKLDLTESAINPHLTEPVNETMATIPQKKQIYGYINEEGKKIGGMVDSQYIKEGEVKNIGEWQSLTKANGIRYWDYWYGKEGEMGERDKRELEAKDKEGNPFVTEREPVEKRDPKSNSLTKDVLIDDIQALRKKLFLDDDVKFKKEIGYNTNFDKWTEKELKKVKDILKDWKPSWVGK